MRALIVTLTLLAVVAGGGGAAFAQTPDIDFEAVHTAFWQMRGNNSVEALQWFEQEANKYYHGDGYVSVATSQVANDQGQPMTIVTGYVDHDGVAGYDPEHDTTLFRLVQTGPVVGNNVPYEFLDTWGHVYYRGVRAYPSTSFYLGYYGGVGGYRPYYTSYARLGYLRSWRVGWRTSPGYLGWRGRFLGYRSGYAARVGVLRGRYGLARAHYGVGFRYGYHQNYRRTAGVPYHNYGARAYGGHYGGAHYGGRARRR
jgi:hypothetical protein